MKLKLPKSEKGFTDLIVRELRNAQKNSDIAKRTGSKVAAEIAKVDRKSAGEFLRMLLRMGK